MEGNKLHPPPQLDDMARFHTRERISAPPCESADRSSPLQCLIPELENGEACATADYLSLQRLAVFSRRIAGTRQTTDTDLQSNAQAPLLGNVDLLDDLVDFACLKSGEAVDNNVVVEVGARPVDALLRRIVDTSL